MSQIETQQPEVTTAQMVATCLGRTLTELEARIVYLTAELCHCTWEMRASDRAAMQADAEVLSGEAA